MGRKKRVGSKAKAKQQARVEAQKNVSVPKFPWDHGASGPANRRDLVVEKMPGPNDVTRARRIDLLETYHKRKWISTAGFNAAEKLRRAWESTMKAPGWPDNDRVQSSPKPDHAVAIQIDRLSEFHSVWRHVESQDREIIEMVAIGNFPISSIRRYQTGRAFEDGKTALREALDRLARRIGG